MDTLNAIFVSGMSLVLIVPGILIFINDYLDKKAKIIYGRPRLRIRQKAPIQSKHKAKKRQPETIKITVFNGRGE